MARVPLLPGNPAPDLTFIQAGQAFADLNVLFERPLEPGERDQHGQARGVAAVEGQFPGAMVLAGARQFCRWRDQLACVVRSAPGVWLWGRCQISSQLALRVSPGIWVLTHIS